MPEATLPLPQPGDTWKDDMRNGIVKVLCLMKEAPCGLSDRETFIVQLSRESAARLKAHAARPLPLGEERNAPLCLKVTFHCDGPDCHAPPFVLYQKAASGAVHLMSCTSFLAGRFSLDRPHHGEMSSMQL